MELWSHVRKLWTRAANVSNAPRVHDFTFSFAGNLITHVKSLDGDRAFFVGEAAGIKPGDAIIARPSLTSDRIRYRVESAQCRSDGTFRAYARVERVLTTKTSSRTFSVDLVRWVPQKGYQRTR